MLLWTFTTTHITHCETRSERCTPASVAYLLSVTRTFILFYFMVCLAPCHDGRMLECHDFGSCWTGVLFCSLWPHCPPHEYIHNTSTHPFIFFGFISSSLCLGCRLLRTCYFLDQVVCNPFCPQTGLISFIYFYSKEGNGRKIPHGKY
jgi:hypothetical protein